MRKKRMKVRDIYLHHFADIAGTTIGIQKQFKNHVA